MKGISVVVCTYNGRDRVEPTLKALFLQQVAQEFNWEIIVVDNASTDDTDMYCEQLHSRYLFTGQFTVIKEFTPGLNHARLKGLRSAKFDWVLFCDDDNHLFPDYLQTGFTILTENKNIGVLGGNGIPLLEGIKPGWFDRYSHSFAVGAQSSANGKIGEYPAEVYGAGAFFRREPLLHLFDKGFACVMSDRKGNSLSSGGDVEWCYLLQLAGYEIWFDQRLTFLHWMPNSRITWSYYLQLKKGIVSGSARLFSYSCLLKEPTMSLRKFKLLFFLKFSLTAGVYFKFHLMRFFRGKTEKQGQLLTDILVSTRLNTFYRDRTVAFTHFEYLKTFF